MERIWSPWRSQYIEAQPTATEECFLCVAGRCTSASVKELVVATFEHWVVLLNRYPYNAGHVLIAPRAHVAVLSDLAVGASASFHEVLQQTVEIVTEVLHPDGVNIGLNLGAAAGAGVPGHLHWHVVPRWRGDANFMATTADTRVISSAIEDQWLRMSKAYDDQFDDQ
ncbi:MAG: HIT family protein [Candidatus Kapaibacteriota bacterium]